MRGMRFKNLPVATVLALIAALILTSSFARADQPALSTTQLAANDWAIENPATIPGKAVLTPTDEKFLDDLESRGIQFYIDFADPVTGLLPDRAKANGAGPGEIASIASVGFGLTALCVGDHHGWVLHQEAYDRSMRVLRFLRYHAPQTHGYFYHWLNMHTGAIEWNSEVSDIDTALLMAGVLTVRQHFAG